MKTIGLRTRILFPLALALITLLAAFVFNIYLILRKDIARDVQRHLKSVMGILEKRLSTEADLIGEAIIMLSNYSQFHSAWATGDRAVLQNLTSPYFARLRTMYRVTHFYFHDTNRINFLRVHKPEKHGDLINRYTLLEAQKTGQLSHGLEIGPLGTLTFRVVYPWRINDRLVGYIEMGKEIDNIMRDLHVTLNVELFVVIHKKYLNREDWESGMQMLGRKGKWDQYSSSVIISQTLKMIPKTLDNFLSVEHHKPMEIAADLEIAVNKRFYQGGFVPLYDAKKVEVGEIVVLHDVTEQKVASRNSVIALSTIWVVIGAVLFLLIYTILGKIEGELTKHRQHLRELVEERTARLQKANEQLREEIAERKKAEIKLSNSQEELRNLFAYHQTIREEERTSVAREVHDELGQLLTALKIEISDYKGLFKDKKIIKKTDNILEHLNMSIQTVKRITSDLRPGILDRLGILPAIQWYAKEFQKRTKIKCVFTFSSEDIMLEKDLSSAIFRIFQESLTNVARHANASSVRADLTKDENRLILEIVDDGKGITEKEISSPDSYGLIGIRERVHFLGGKTKIKGEKGKGTTVTITIPLAE